MILKILIGVAAIAVVAALVIALQPSEFRVARSATVAAPPAMVFAQVNDFHNWTAWSPWEKVDPAMKRSYEGAPAGVGAVYQWSGNNEVGEGRSTIVESRPDELVRIRLEFFRPFKATSNAQLTFKPDGERTVVTWSLDGDKTFVTKAVHLFINMDRMVGGQFEKGLADLKATAEASASGPRTAPSTRTP